MKLSDSGGGGPGGGGTQSPGDVSAADSSPPDEHPVDDELLIVTTASAVALIGVCAPRTLYREPRVGVAKPRTRTFVCCSGRIHPDIRAPLTAVADGGDNAAAVRGKC